MEELRNRTDSLAPPYPSFGAFIRSLLESGQRARQIADKIGVREKAVHAWAADNQPGTQHHRPISERLSFDFGELAFREAAEETGFPPRNAPKEIRDIRTNRALRDYISQFGKRTNLEALIRLCGFTTRSMFTGFSHGHNLSRESIVKILRKLPEVPHHLSGEVLSPLTPTIKIATTARDLRLQSGLERKAFAAKLGVSFDYLRYLEDLLGRTPEEQRRISNATQNVERLERLCKALMEERKRLNGGEPPSADEAPEHRTGRAALEELDQPDDLAEAWRAIRALQAEVQALRAMRAGRPPKALRAEDEPYVSPLSEARWQEHGVTVDATRVRLVRLAILMLTEELGFLAGIQDETLRATVREELAAPLSELFMAIEAFGKKHPFSATMQKLIASWRQEFALELK